MVRFMVRVLGVALLLGGGALLAYLAMASFSDDRQWVNVLLAIGMPLMCVLVLFGFGVAGWGLWLLTHDRRPNPGARP